jgi:hypothetical protein
MSDKSAETTIDTLKEILTDVNEVCEDAEHSAVVGDILVTNI